MTDETNKKPRAAVKKGFYDNNLIIIKSDGAKVTDWNPTEAMPGTQLRWAVEAMIGAYQGGASVEDIISGKALPDRSLPAVKVAKPDKATPETVLAIARTYGDQLIADETTGIHGPKRERKEELRALALGYALELDAAGRKTAQASMLGFLAGRDVRIGPVLLKPEPVEVAA